MARATAYSTNTYFMTIEERTGICRPAEIAESMGVRLGNGDPLLRVPTLAIGTMEVTPLAMANAYATFAAHGIYCKPVVILDIPDREGKRLPVPDGDCTRVIKRDVADTVTVMLNGVVDGSIPGRTGQTMSARGSAGRRQDRHDQRLRSGLVRRATPRRSPQRSGSATRGAATPTR